MLAARKRAAKNPAPVSRTLTLIRVRDDKGRLTAFCGSGNATYCCKHLFNGEETGFPKGIYVSSTLHCKLFHDTTGSTGWLPATSWWHFLDITVPGGPQELQRVYDAIQAAAADVTIDGEKPVKVTIEEREHMMVSGDADRLCKIWPALAEEASSK